MEKTVVQIPCKTRQTRREMRAFLHHVASAFEGKVEWSESWGIRRSMFTVVLDDDVADLFVEVE